MPTRTSARAPTCSPRTTPSIPSARNVTFIKFNTGSLANSAVQQAVLQLWGQNDGSASQVIAHVYGLTNDNWNESTITWNTAPNLAASVKHRAERHQP